MSLLNLLNFLLGVVLRIVFVLGGLALLAVTLIWLQAAYHDYLARWHTQRELDDWLSELQERGE